MSSTIMVLLYRLLISAWRPIDPSPNEVVNGESDFAAPISRAAPTGGHMREYKTGLACSWCSNPSTPHQPLDLQPPCASIGDLAHSELNRRLRSWNTENQKAHPLFSTPGAYSFRHPTSGLHGGFVSLTLKGQSVHP